MCVCVCMEHTDKIGDSSFCSWVTELEIITNLFSFNLKIITKVYVEIRRTEIV